MAIGRVLDAAGWKQGKILPVVNHMEALNGTGLSLEGEERLVVISQSCDILARSDDLEPNVELIIARPIPNLDPSMTYCNHPREFHCSFGSTNGHINFSLVQRDKFSISRRVLSQIGSPDPEVFLTDRTVADMARWLASRYQRPAFPNEFEARLRNVSKKKRNKERKAAKNISPIVAGIFINLTPYDEIGTEENYQLNLIALVSVEHLHKNEGIAACDLPGVKDRVEEIVAVMEAANMEVSSRIEWENRVPYSMIKNDYKPWAYDGISLREDPHHPLP